MMQYTATIQHATSPSTQRPRRKTCTLSQIHDRTCSLLFLHIFNSIYFTAGSIIVHCIKTVASNLTCKPKILQCLYMCGYYTHIQQILYKDILLLCIIYKVRDHWSCYICFLHKVLDKNTVWLMIMVYVAVFTLWLHTSLRILKEALYT